MTSTCKDVIHKHFYEGENDKGMKKSAALMVEAMIKELDSSDSHPNKKHYIPCVSEATVVIGQMSTARNNQSK